MQSILVGQSLFSGSKILERRAHSPLYGGISGILTYFLKVQGAQGVTQLNLNKY